METAFSQLLFDPLAEWTLRQITEAATQQFYAFTLVLIRVSGLMVVGPVFGQTVVPVNIRVLLTVAISLVLAPALSTQSQTLVQRLDQNADGWISREEVPEHLLDRFDAQVGQSTQYAAVDAIPASSFGLRAIIPPNLLEYLAVVAQEFALGALLGMGVFIVMSGLQMAGQVIDQQTGIALGEVFNPGMEDVNSLSGQILYLLGVTVFLVMLPWGGHLRMVSTLMETFVVFPVGEAHLSASAIEFIELLIGQSLLLAVRIAAPILATMSLISLSMGFLSHTVPQINILMIGFPVRILAGLSVLILTISSIGDLVVGSVGNFFGALRDVLGQGLL